jgi:hypothetical protein
MEVCGFTKDQVTGMVDMLQDMPEGCRTCQPGDAACHSENCNKLCCGGSMAHAVAVRCPGLQRHTVVAILQVACLWAVVVEMDISLEAQATGTDSAAPDDCVQQMTGVCSVCNVTVGW